MIELMVARLSGCTSYLPILCFVSACGGSRLAAQQAPDADALEQLIGRMKQSALRYQGHLPDFTCTEVTVRKQETSGGQWRTQDSFEELVALAPGRISKKLVKWNGRPTSKTSPGGLTENAVLAGLIVPSELMPRAQARFEWDHWEARGDHSIAVLAYTAVGENYPDGKTRYELKVSGRIFFDDTAGDLVRLESSNVGPPGYRYGEVSVEADYAVVPLSGHELILPASAVVTTTEGKRRYRHEIQFSEYRKYQADSALRFDEAR